jgi:hypothetical protein
MHKYSTGHTNILQWNIAKPHVMGVVGTVRNGVTLTVRIRGLLLVHLCMMPNFSTFRLQVFALPNFQNCDKY